MQVDSVMIKVVVILVERRARRDKDLCCNVFTVTRYCTAASDHKNIIINLLTIIIPGVHKNSASNTLI